MTASKDGRVDAVVLAGARNDGPLADSADAEWEALIDVGGRPMAAWVLEALRDTGRVGRVAVVGPPEPLSALADPERGGVAGGDGFDLTFPGDAGGLLANLELGFRSLASERPVLVATGDIPLVTPEAVTDFLAACEAEEADVHYPIIRREDSEARYPGVVRTYVRLLDGEFTGGNVALVAPHVVTRHRAVFEQAVAMRKNPIGLARLFGLGLLLKMLLGRLRVRDVEARFVKAFGLKGRAVLCPHPEIGMDVDKPADLELIRRVWEHKGALKEPGPGAPGGGGSDAR